ncbi:hypothetical protein RBH88_03420 [Aminobacterium sp. MB27-C1]|uniref:tetratricopeptide repeat protein n=1 Tax=Aminobacterium sp. MB27-C1 TaxID=3070661 RepID=UPI0027DBE8A8|nr:hypothetical protein [Aminobacterium sp. MB27-C1]WMI72164.1 hypothetical protein RBH88_03420 [Aminobacterium sp. MB27-C1]
MFCNHIKMKIYFFASIISLLLFSQVSFASPLTTGNQNTETMPSNYLERNINILQDEIDTYKNLFNEKIKLLQKKIPVAAPFTEADIENEINKLIDEKLLLKQQAFSIEKTKLDIARDNINWWMTFLPASFALIGVWGLFKGRTILSNIEHLYEKVTKIKNDMDTLYKDSKKTKEEIDNIREAIQKTEKILPNRTNIDNEELASKITEGDLEAIKTVISNQEGIPFHIKLKAYALKFYNEKEWEKSISFFTPLLLLDPNDFSICFFLGNAYYFWSKNSTGDDFSFRMKKASDLYEKATLINANNSSVRNNLGVVLSALAEKQEDQDIAIKLLNDACEKYEQATSIDKNNSNAWYNWGNALSELAKKDEDQNVAIELLNDACEKYEKAISIYDKDYRVWNNLKETLIALAKLTKDEDQKSKLLERIQKVHEQMVKLKKD